MIGGRTDVVKDSQRPVEFREDNIDAAIVVQVTERCATVHASAGKRRTSPGREVSKLPMAHIREDNVGLRHSGAKAAFGIHHMAAGGE